MTWTDPCALDAPATPAPVGATARGVHVTRRGRAVVLVLLVGLLLAAFSVGRVGGSHAATAAAPPVALQQTTVHRGETLWAVARRIAPHNDPRDVVAQIVRINHLGSGDVLVGQQLLLPRVA